MMSSSSRLPSTDVTFGGAGVAGRVGVGLAATVGDGGAGVGVCPDTSRPKPALITSAQSANPVTFSLFRGMSNYEDTAGSRPFSRCEVRAAYRNLPVHVNCFQPACEKMCR